MITSIPFWTPQNSNAVHSLLPSSSSSESDKDKNSLFGSGEIAKQAPGAKVGKFKSGETARKRGTPLSHSASNNSTCETHDLIRWAPSADVGPESWGAGAWLEKNNQARVEMTERKSFTMYAASSLPPNFFFPSLNRQGKQSTQTITECFLKTEKLD